MKFYLDAITTEEIKVRRIVHPKNTEIKVEAVSDSTRYYVNPNEDKITFNNFDKRDTFFVEGLECSQVYRAEIAFLKEQTVDCNVWTPKELSYIIKFMIDHDFSIKFVNADNVLLKPLKDHSKLKEKLENVRAAAKYE